MTSGGVCRTGDTVTGTCNLHDDPEDFTGTWDPKPTSDIKSDGLAIIVKGDPGSASCGHKFYAVGSQGTDVQALGLPLQRIGDQAYIDNNPDNGVGTSITGSPNVISS